MKKALVIAQKDILIRLYDKSAFAFLIITPLIITIIMGFTFGGSDDNEVNFTVPVAIVNHDTGYKFDAAGTPMPNDAPQDGLNLGQVLADILTSEDLGQILNSTVVGDEAAARAAVDAGKTYCCVVVIPANFSQSVFLNQKTDVIIYSDPARQISAQIITGIVQQITDQFSSGALAFGITIEQLFASGRIAAPADVEAVSQLLAAEFQQNSGPTQSLAGLETLDASGEEVDFDPVAFFAPSMAIIFLAFGASQGARSILAEEEAGTFDRLNSTPTPVNAILLGKLLGTFFSGAIQFAVLIIASTLLFSLIWGDWLAVLVLSIFIILAFTSLGLVMAVIAKDENQANTIGTSVLLVFMVIGGNLTPPGAFPAWMQNISKITPNYWGITGFIKLGLSEGLPELGPEIIALAIISVALFVLGSVLYKRRVAV